MLKRILQVLLAFVAVLVILALTANMLAVPLEEMEPVDPAMLITMPDGTERALADVVAAAEEVEDPVVHLRLPMPDEASVEILEMSREEAADHVMDLDTRRGDDRIVVVWDEDEPLTPEAVREHLRQRVLEQWDENPPDGSDLVELARYERHKGRPEQAVALLRSVPKGHRHYAKAQRDLAWKLYTQELKDPRRGIAHVNESIKADPFDGNAWEDLVRVYGAGIGLPID